MGEMTVGQLEKALFSAFPHSDAESWDKPGLAVGDRAAVVSKVAFNLDMSTRAVLEAARAGCNVLVTHHPPFIKGGPEEFGPAAQAETPGPGRMVFEAARLGVNVIAMHTNADRSIAVREQYARLLGCTCQGNFEFLLDARRMQAGTGFGALLQPPAGETLTLDELARRCLAAFGGAPRVWGEPTRGIRRFALLNGSWSEPELALACHMGGVECIIVGETRYHMCVDAQPALSVIELGHDRSELAIVDVLEACVCNLGIAGDRRVRLACSASNWWVPSGR